MVNDWMARGVLRCGGSLRLRLNYSSNLLQLYCTSSTAFAGKKFLLVRVLITVIITNMQTTKLQS